MTDPLLAVRQAADRLAAAEASVDDARAARDAALLAARDAGARVVDIAAAAGITRDGYYKLVKTTQEKE